jgi:hypothetical protein
MMRQCVTFVGPIQEVGTKRKRKFAILVLQTGSPINLEYDSDGEASAARRALLATPNAYSVPTVKLLLGVHTAIHAAVQAAIPTQDAEGEAA